MRWVKCKNRLPELHTDVLMFFDNGNEQNMSKKCVCGNEMTREDWKHEWVCHRCGRKRPIPLPPMFTVFMCRKCEHLLYVEEDEDFPQKLGKIAAKSCPCCGEQEEGLWRLLGRAEGFEGTVFTEESDED